MSTKEAYLNEVEVQLKAWNTAIDGLVAKVGQAQTEARNQFHQLVQDFSANQAEAIERLEALKRADNLEWEQHKARLVQLMITLRQKFEQLKKAAESAENESIGWAQGLAEKDVVQSIGWAEGVAKEDVVESIGWAEGVAEEDDKES
jgi:predicted nuclease with TOPRIM domain